jgi:hypothetical protein
MEKRQHERGAGNSALGLLPFYLHQRYEDASCQPALHMKNADARSLTGLHE